MNTLGKLIHMYTKINVKNIYSIVLVLTQIPKQLKCSLVVEWINCYKIICQINIHTIKFTEFQAHVNIYVYHKNNIECKIQTQVKIYNLITLIKRSKIQYYIKSFKVICISSVLCSVHWAVITKIL